MGRRGGGADGCVAAVEAGGTKFRVAVGSGPDDVRFETTIATSTPGETIGAAVSFVRDTGLPIEGLGIGAFGPIDLDGSSPTFGRILSTPKPAWSGADMLGGLREPLGVPARIETDVAAAALAERRWGAARAVDDLVYITVGTGVGVGILLGGKVHFAMGHPEAGHIPVRREPDDPFPGNCPFHGDCLEGMAAGPAIEARWGRPGRDLSGRDEVWDLEARYLAQAVRALTYAVAPQRFVFGGGVTRQPGLVERIAERVPTELGGYAASPALLQGSTGYVVAAGLGQDAGMLGAIALGLEAARR
jgi:fructokinase